MLGAFALVTLLVGVLEVTGEIDCERGPLLCQPHLPSPGGSVETLIRDCPKHIAYYECMEEYINSCEGSDPDPDSALIPDLLAYLRDVCDINSDTHAAMVKHLDCLQSQLFNQEETCKAAVLRALSSYVEANEISEDNADFAKLSLCFRVSSFMACYLDQAEEKCEDGAKDFVLDALRRTKYLEKVCSSQNSAPEFSPETSRIQDVAPSRNYTRIQDAAPDRKSRNHTRIQDPAPDRKSRN